MAENKERQKLVHLHTSEEKVPTKDILELGEIAVQHNDAAAALYIKKNNGEIAKFIDATAVDAKIKVETDRAKEAESALTAQITAEATIARGAEEALANRINTLEGSDHTHANKTVLEGIDADRVATWDAAETKAKQYADGLAKNYDAAGAAATVKSDVIGTDGDNKEKDTIKGTKKYADSAAAQALADAKSYAEGLNTVMDGRVDILETSSHTHTNKEVLNGITKEKVDAWDAAEANAISSAETYTDNTIAALKLADTYAKKSVVETLVGEDANKSARNIAAEEVAKVVADAPENFDTLKEIADWISSDTTGSAQMANDIKALKAISADTRLTTLEAINAGTRLTTLEAISASTRLATLEGKSHSHKNIDLLETYTQTEANLADAVRKKHEHTNKEVLDGITAKKVTDWDAAKADAISLAKTYTDSVASGKANTVHTHKIADVTGLQGALDGKAASAHTHKIADVTGLQGALDGKDSNGAAAQALKDAKSYADGLAKNYDAAGAAAQALTDAKAYTNAQIAVLRIDCGTY